MANIYKNEKTSLTTTALTTLYTVPSNSRAIVKSLLVAEDAGSTAVVKVTLVDAAAAIFVIDNDVNLTANQKEQVLSEPLIMKESEILKVQASSGAVDVVASVLEINRRIDNAICRTRRRIFRTKNRRKNSQSLQAKSRGNYKTLKNR